MVNQNNSKNQIEKKLESLYAKASNVLSLSLKLNKIESEHQSFLLNQSLSQLAARHASENMTPTSLNLSEAELKSYLVEQSELQSEIASTSVVLSESDSESMSILLEGFESMSHFIRQLDISSQELTAYLVTSEQDALNQNMRRNGFNSAIGSARQVISHLESLSEVSPQDIYQLKKVNQDLSERNSSLDSSIQLLFNSALGESYESEFSLD